MLERHHELACGELRKVPFEGVDEGPFKSTPLATEIESALTGQE